MRHAHWRMCHQKTAPDSAADIRKETIMVTALRLGLISIVISLLAAVPTGYAEKGKHSTSQLWAFAATEVVPGGKSELFRSDDEICMNIHTKALREGAYTIWWFAFNSPEHCTSPVAVGRARCGSGDVGNTAVNASVLWATGGIVGPDGVGYFNACLDENKLPPPPQSQDIDGLGPGLADARGAEIHLWVRSHCAAEWTPTPPSVTPVLLGEQITRYGGGCTMETGGGAFGMLGDCDCTDLQFAIHPPKQQQHEDD
jgi:hypothetical protein